MAGVDWSYAFAFPHVAVEEAGLDISLYIEKAFSHTYTYISASYFLLVFNILFPLHPKFNQENLFFFLHVALKTTYLFIHLIVF